MQKGGKKRQIEQKRVEYNEERRTEAEENREEERKGRNQRVGDTIIKGREVKRKE